MDISQIGAIAASVAVGYILGSVPVAYLLTRARGVNVFEVGTQNPGAANVFREVNKRLGALVLLLDALKAFLAVVAANLMGVDLEAASVAGAAAVVGHWHPVFLKFKGGMGLAPAIGAGIALAPITSLIALLIGLSTLAIIRNTGYAAVTGYIAFVSLNPVFDTEWAATAGAASLIVLVWLRSIAVATIWPRFARRNV